MVLCGINSAIHNKISIDLIRNNLIYKGAFYKYLHNKNINNTLLVYKSYKNDENSHSEPH